MTKKPAIVVLTKTDGGLAFFGPFADGQAATEWGFVNCKGFEWFWQDLNPVNQPEED